MNKALFLVCMMLLCTGITYSQNSDLKPKVVKPVYFDVSPPLSEIARSLRATPSTSWKDGVVKNHFDQRQNNNAVVVDKVEQQSYPESPLVSTDQNFDGNTNTEGYVPPDTDGDVSTNYYFQVVNCHYSIYSKTGSLLLGPVENSAVWNGMPNNSNDGDAVVIYDSQADRWVFTQFSLPNYPDGPFYQMIAISQTNNPLGSWYRYEYSFSDMNDYPKFGIWPDGYYMSANRFSAGSFNYAGTAVYAYNRSLMLIGDSTAQQVSFTLSSSDPAFGFLPADCDGSFPASGTPEYFAYINKNTYNLRVYQFHVDWTTTSNSTFGSYQDISVSSFNTTTSQNYIPQQGTSVKLDPIEDRLMYRMQYRSFSDHKSMVVCHNVNNTSGVTGVRWYELRNTGSTWTKYQEGTYNPGDGAYRWMGSIAMDANGDIALGYSKSSSGMYPSVYFTGRLSTDALNTMTVTESVIQNGSGYQSSSSHRWGDYSAMTIDPSSSNTFWYTQEYIQTTGQANWKTRIASFHLGTAGVPLSVTATANPAVCNPGAAVQLSTTASGGTGSYTYSWSSNPAGFTSTSQNPVAYPLINTTYSVLVTDGASSGTGSCSVTVNMSATATATPSVINPGSNSQLSVSVQGGSGVYTYSWTSIPAGFTSTSANPVVSPAMNTSYYVTVSDGSQTVNASCIVTVNMTVNPTATPSAINVGSSSQLSANVLGGSGNYTYSWTSVPAGFTSTGASPVVTPSVTTVYTVAVNDGTHLMSGSCTVSVNLAVNASANPSSINLGGTSQLSSVAQGGSGTFTYSWVSTPAGFTSNQQNPVVSPTVSTMYTVTANDGSQNQSASANVLVNMTVNVTATPSTINAGQSSQLNTTVTGGSGTYTYSWVSNPAGFASSSPNPVVTPTVNTIYTVTVNDGTLNANGSATVNVNLSSSASASPSSICAGDSTQLSANAMGGSGNYTYSWTSTPSGFTSTQANPVVTPSATTTYTVQVIDGSNTTNSMTTVYVTALPVVNAGSDTIVCKDVVKMPVYGTASNQSSVTWTTSGDGTFQNPTLLSTYYYPGANDRNSSSVTLTLTAHPNTPCSSNISDNKVVTIDACTGISHVSGNDFGVSVLPNPSRGLFMVSITGVASGTLHLTVYNANGQMVYSEDVNSTGNITEKNMDLVSFSKGVYLLKVEAGDKERTVRVVID
ncbi:MAG: T9SS type A sorting domain-containing protein [Bacteroidota bacterium]|nr:T9SS type A sorting domain-containing protein [Bacteroidota bacterium]